MDHKLGDTTSQGIPKQDARLNVDDITYPGDTD